MSDQDLPHSQSLLTRKETRVTFDQLVTSHQHAIYIFIRSMIFNPADARDIQQDVNLILIRKKDNFEIGTNFKAWAFTIARFECLTYLNRYKKNQTCTLDPGILESLADIAEKDSNNMQPWLLALRKCVGALPDEAKKMLQARYEDKTPLETAAADLQTSITAFKQKLYRIRNNLKNCILERLKAEKHQEL